MALDQYFALGWNLSLKNLDFESISGDIPGGPVVKSSPSCRVLQVQSFHKILHAASCGE